MTFSSRLFIQKKRIQGWLKGKVGIEGTEERAVSEEVVCDYEDHKGSRNAVCRFFITVVLKSILEEVCRGGCLQESVRRRLYEVDGGRKRFGKA